MEPSEKKIRIPLWIYPSTLEKVKSQVPKDNCRNQSEFIEKAILFYSGYLNAQDSPEYLPKVICGTVKGIVDESESRMARVIFKLAVETAIMMNITAAGFDVDEQTLGQIRSRCIKDIKQSTGAISFTEAVMYQRD